MRTGSVWLLAFAALALAGAPLLADPRFGRFSPASRAVLAALAGAVLTSDAMLLWTLLGWRWNAAGVLACGAALALALRAALPRRREEESPPRELPLAPTSLDRISVVVTIAGIAAAAVATVAGSATSGDLVLFWGAKGQQFALARTIDAAFLKDPCHSYLQTSYPPLLTNLYALSTLVAGRFSWGAAALTFPLGLAILAVALPGVLSQMTSRSSALGATALAVASISAAGAASLIAGNAEMPLLIFEAVAIGILMGPIAASRGGALLAGLMLAGAASTKVEGLVFALAVLLVVPVIQRLPPRTLPWLAGPTALSIGLWLFFGSSRGVFEGFGAAGPLLEVSWRRTPQVLSAIGRALASTVYGLPYLLPVLALLLSPRKSRSSLAPLLTAACLSAGLVFSYLHGREDPSNWIRWSAARVFLPVSVLLVLGAAATGGDASDGTR